MSDEKKTSERNIEYNCGNLPFKSSSHFIIPFRAKKNIASSSFLSKEFTEYDINEKVFSVNSDLKMHLSNTDNPILKVYEKVINEEYYFNRDTEQYRLDNAIDERIHIKFSVNYVRFYIFNDSVNFAYFGITFSSDTELEDVALINHCIKYNNHFNKMFDKEIQDAIGVIKENIPEYDKKKPSFLIEMLMSYIGRDIELLSNEAYLYNYTFCKDDEYNDENLFYLATGSRYEYKYAEDTEFKKYVQSANVMQAIVKNGISRIVKHNGNNFYCDPNNPNGMIASIYNNYIFVYILALHQYFGLRYLNYCILEKNKERHQTKIYNLKDSKTIYKEFSNIKSKAEQFYLENVFVDISHVLHINRTYNLIRDVLHISEIIDDFYKDLEICNTIIEEHTISSKLNKINHSAGWILAASIISILCSLLQTAFTIWG